MRKTRVLLVTLMLAGAAPAWAETVRIGVNGLVCAFCVSGIEKSFKKEAAVDSVAVDLTSKVVTLHTKPQQPLDDATITNIITNSGYTITKISREK